jgi:hypothetical protein
MPCSYRSIDELQVDSDLWIREYNEQRPRRQAPMELLSAGVKAMRQLGSRRRHETYDICFAGNRVVDFRNRVTICTSRSRSSRLAASEAFPYAKDALCT